MFNDDDGQSLDLIANFQNVIHQLRRLVMGHAGRWFIQKKKLRPVDKRAADFDTAPVDHRQAGRGLEHAVREWWIEHLYQRARRLVVLLEFALESAPVHQIEPKPLV